MKSELFFRSICAACHTQSVFKEVFIEILRFQNERDCSKDKVWIFSRNFPDYTITNRPSEGIVKLFETFCPRFCLQTALEFCLKQGISEVHTLKSRKMGNLAFLLFSRRISNWHNLS